MEESKNHAKSEHKRSLGVETLERVTIDSYSPSSVEPSVRPAAPGSCSLEVAAEHLRTLEDFVLSVADAVHNLVAIPPLTILHHVENVEAIEWIYRALEDVQATCTGIQVSAAPANTGTRLPIVS